jgi:hypothetical protein
MRLPDRVRASPIHTRSKAVAVSDRQANTGTMPASSAPAHPPCYAEIVKGTPRGMSSAEPRCVTPPFASLKARAMRRATASAS